MDGLSDYVLLPILYRCPSATFLSRKTRIRSYRIRKWISIKEFCWQLNNYERLTHLRVTTVRWTEIQVNKPILEGIVSITFVDLLTCSLGALELGRMCPNLASFQLYSARYQDGMTLKSLPKSLTRLIIPWSALGPDISPVLDGNKILEALPLLTETNLSVPVSSNMRQMGCMLTNQIEVTSSSLEHLSITGSYYPPFFLNSEDPNLTLHCPQLTSIEVQHIITAEVMNAILTCKNLTSLVVAGYRTEPSMLLGLTKLQHLKISGMSLYIMSSELPQSLTHLDIEDCQGQLSMDEKSLHRLLTLKCASVGPQLPKNLRELVCNGYYIIQDLSHTSLTSLTITLALDTQVELPDSLTELSLLCDPTSIEHMPKSIPPRLKRLTILNSYVPEEWSIANIQYLECEGPLSETQQKEFKGRSPIRYVAHEDYE